MKRIIILKDTIKYDNVLKLIIFLFPFLPAFGGKSYINILVIPIAALLLTSYKSTFSRSSMILALITVLSIISLLLSNPSLDIRNLFQLILFEIILFFCYQCGRLIVLDNKLINVLLAILFAESVICLLELSSIELRSRIFTIYGINIAKYITESQSLFSVVGTIGNPNDYAIFINLLFILIILADRELNSELVSKSTVLESVAFLLSAINIYFSFSRTGVLLFLMLVILIGIESHNHWFLFLVILVTVVFYHNINKLGSNALIRRFEGVFIGGLDIDFGARERMWRIYLDEIRHFNLRHLFLGMGNNYYETFFSAVDNQYIYIMLSNGVLGIIIYILKILFIIIWDGPRHLKVHLLLLILISGIVMSIGPLENILIFLFLGVFEERHEKKPLSNNWIIS